MPSLSERSGEGRKLGWLVQGSFRFVPHSHTRELLLNGSVTNLPLSGHRVQGHPLLLAEFGDVVSRSGFFFCPGPLCHEISSQLHFSWSPTPIRHDTARQLPFSWTGSTLSPRLMTCCM